MKITAVRSVPVLCPRRRQYGGIVKTALGAGTKVVMRVPKFRSGVRASGGASA